MVVVPLPEAVMMTGAAVADVVAVVEGAALDEFGGKKRLSEAAAKSNKK